MKRQKHTLKTKATFYTYDRQLVKTLKQMKEDSFAYECPENHFHLVYPIEEYGHKIFRREVKAK